MSYGELDHNSEPELDVTLCVCVCVCVCACEQSSKLADNIEQKIMNNKLFKTTSTNV